VSASPADPPRRGRPCVRGDPCAFAAALIEEIAPREQAGWSATWSRADAAGRHALDAALDAIDEPFEGRLARDLVAALPAGAVLFAGSSMPIRDLDAYMAPREGLRVVGNRGASGIDG